MKVTFEETNKARKAQEHELKLFSMKIPSYDIKQDHFINVMTCMKCYKLEDHTTDQCDQDQAFKMWIFSCVERMLVT